MSRFRFLLLLAIALALGSPTLARKPETGFLDRTLTIRGVTYKYQVFVPDNWSSNQKWPIILFLHGYGERGADGLIQTEVGIGSAIRRDRSRFPALVVIPQCAPHGWWTAAPMEELALAALDAATKEFHGDSQRTYLTGLSMGGFGTWDIASRFPHKFAAIVSHLWRHRLPAGLPEDLPEITKHSYPDVPASYAEVAAKIGKTPVWIFHGGSDNDVPVEYSRKMFAALKADGADVRYNRISRCRHNSWDKAYAEPELMIWLLSKSL